MSNDAIPFFEDGNRITCTATTAVVGKTFVKISGDVQSDGTYSVAPAGAGDPVFGVAAWSAAQGKQVTVYALASGMIVPVYSTGGVAAGARVKSAAAGAAVTAGDGDPGYGVVMTAAADQTDAQIKLGFNFEPGQ